MVSPVVKTSRGKSKSSRLRNRSGQGALEYILLLFVIVSIGLGILYQFNSAFRSFASNYFGNYLACLLETGELPSLGSTEGSGGQCDSSFKPFDLAEGRPLRESPTGGGGSQGGGGSSNPAANNPNPAARPGQKNSSPASGSQAEPPTTAGGRGEPPLETGGNSAPYAGNPANIPAADSARANPPDASSSGGAGAGRGQKVDLTASELSQVAKAGAGDSDEGRLRYIPSKKDGAGDNDGLRKRNLEASASDVENGSRRVPADFNKNKKGQEGEADVGLSLPDFFRYLIIAAIIIAIVFFFGGQALQFSKSQEK